MLMEVTVRFIGPLRFKVPDYDHEKGLEVELHSDATLLDLFEQLYIDESQRVIVTMDYRALKVTDRLQHGADLYIFASLSGG